MVALVTQSGALTASLLANASFWWSIPTTMDRNAIQATVDRVAEAEVLSLLIQETAGLSIALHGQ
jgi:hypothetical protein